MERTCDRFALPAKSVKVESLSVIRVVGHWRNLRNFAPSKTSNDHQNQ